MMTATTITPLATVTTANLAGRLTGEAMIAKYTGSRLCPTRDEIDRLAYHFYVSRGRRDGNHLEDWLLAEQELVHHYR